MPKNSLTLKLQVNICTAVLFVFLPPSQLCYGLFISFKFILIFILNVMTSFPYLLKITWEMRVTLEGTDKVIIIFFAFSVTYIVMLCSWGKLECSLMRLIINRTVWFWYKLKFFPSLILILVCWAFNHLEHKIKGRKSINSKKKKKKKSVISEQH